MEVSAAKSWDLGPVNTSQYAQRLHQLCLEKGGGIKGDPCFSLPTGCGTDQNSMNRHNITNLSRTHAVQVPFHSSLCSVCFPNEEKAASCAPSLVCITENASAPQEGLR